MSAAPLRVVIADDEPLARERLRTLLAEHAGYVAVGECADGRSALALVGREAPDLLLLDVQMPELDGFDVAAALPAGVRPAIVFVTAFDRYALDAFDANAVDYLVKPVERERFARALERARSRVAAGEPPAALEELVAVLRRDAAPPVRFVCRDRRGYYFVAADELDWIEAEGNYVALHAGKASHLVRDTLAGVEARLDPARFLRVHRSALVHVAAIDRIEPYAHGTYVITLRDGTRLTSSRAHSEPLRRRLQLK